MSLTNCHKQSFLHLHLLVHFACKLCAVVLSFGKFESQVLLMGLCDSQDILQEEMSILRNSLEFVYTCTNELLCFTKESFDDLLKKLELILI